MDNSRLKYYATDDCIKRVAEKYIDDYAMDLDAICKKKSNKTFLIMERDSEKQNPITLATLEKHSNNFYCIELISPFNILLNTNENFSSCISRSNTIRIPSKYQRRMDTRENSIKNSK